MKTINSTNRTLIFLFTISVVYSFLDTNLLMLIPIFTVVVPHKFMKDDKCDERKLLTRIIIFNIITFLSVSTILNKTSIYIFETITNLIISLVYFLIVSRFEDKYNNLTKNPEKLYEKINLKIQALELMKDKIEKNIDSIENEKKKNSMKIKLSSIENKLNALKDESEKIKKLIDINSKKVD